MKERKGYVGEMFDEHLRLAQLNLQGEPLRITEDLFRRAGLFCFNKNELVEYTQARAESLAQRKGIPNLPFSVSAFEIAFYSVIMTRGEIEGTYIVQVAAFQDLGEIRSVIDETTPGSVIIGASFYIEDCTWEFASISRFNYKGRFLAKSEDVESQYVEGLGFIFGMILVALKAVTDPDRFVVEVEPRLTRKRSKEERKKPLPARERPNFIMLEPLVIKKMFAPKGEKKADDDNEEKIKKAGHYRRGYERWFMHERYTNMRGKSQWVEAVWVGPQEAVVESRRYKVRLDL